MYEVKGLTPLQQATLTLYGIMEDAMEAEERAIEDTIEARPNWSGVPGDPE